MSSSKNNPNMTALAATQIQSAWRSYYEYEPVHDEERQLLVGYVDREKMKDLCDPAYVAWVLDEEEPLVACDPPTLLTPSRYWHPDHVDCNSRHRSPTCRQCFRYFCPFCKNGVGGMFSKCRATSKCRARLEEGLAELCRKSLV